MCINFFQEIKKIPVPSLTVQEGTGMLCFLSNQGAVVVIKSPDM